MLLLNWLSSRHPEFVPSIDGDHTCTPVVSTPSAGTHVYVDITIILTFLRSIPDPATTAPSRASRASFDSVRELPSLRGDS